MLQQRDVRRSVFGEVGWWVLASRAELQPNKKTITKKRKQALLERGPDRGGVAHRDAAVRTASGDGSAAAGTDAILVGKQGGGLLRPGAALG